MKRYIDADKLRASLVERYNVLKIGQHSPFRSGKTETLRETIELIDSLQQEQPEVLGYDRALLEVKSKVDELYEESSIGLNEYDSGLYNGIAETCMKLRGFIKARISSEEQPEADLEKAARNVYESWMGGTMDDVRRDMVELGRVINARKV